jgi:hypothetical protein
MHPLVEFNLEKGRKQETIGLYILLNKQNSNEIETTNPFINFAKLLKKNM